MMRIFTWALVLLACGGPALAAESLVGSLDASQVEQLNHGEMVVTQKNIEGGIWPELTVYTKVGATVQDVSNVFQDYAHAQDYIPNLISAKVIGHPSPNVSDVEYTSKLPIFGTTSYEVRNWYEKSGDGVVVRWKLLKSPMADISDGSLQVEPYEGGSVLRYTNYVKPKSSIAIVARGAALGEVKKTVAAIKNQAERLASGLASAR